ncbi:MerR family DNA-binding transcriptional regulator [Phytoactinopolyspora mesophila]|uniref:DNA polymerase III subunit beta family protein n=1 Tax=Phytoactinopolyspora mesophila TaxID=2650750 RepID=UPI001390C74F
MDDDELRGIGDMAQASGLSVSALRFYDRAGLLIPAVVDPATGYRRYSADQLASARLLAGMRQVGLPLAEIAAVLEQRCDVAAATSVLDAHVRRLEDRLDDARRELRRLRSLLDSEQGEPSRWPDESVSVDVDARALARALDAIRFAVADASREPRLNGALIECESSAVRIVATDRYRLTACEVVAFQRAGTRMSVVAPAGFLDDARALLDHDGDATIDLDRGRIAITAAAAHVSADCMVDAFPDYRQILRRHAGGSRFVVDAQDLRAHVSSVTARPFYRESDGVRTTVITLRAHSDGTFEVTANQPETETDVILDRSFLLEAIDACAAERITLEIAGPLAPVALRRPDDEQFVSLLMPVRP